MIDCLLALITFSALVIMVIVLAMLISVFIDAYGWENIKDLFGLVISMTMTIGFIVFVFLVGFGHLDYLWKQS